jgi:formiminotetrahydrofolate cyclodeaminase
MTVDRFVDEVSTDSPAPGGGSVSALAGALSAGLSAMVANLTVGKKGYEQDWQDLSVIAEHAQAVKDQLVRAVDEDTDAFNGVMAATRMPKATPEQQAAREHALESGFKAAARVPLATANACLDALRLSLLVATKGNVNSASDAGVAALMARAGVEGAVLNVLINLGSIKDAAFRAECATGTENLVLEATHLCEQVLARVKGSMKKA